MAKVAASVIRTAIIVCVIAAFVVTVIPRCVICFLHWVSDGVVDFLVELCEEFE